MQRSTTRSKASEKNQEAGIYARAWRGTMKVYLVGISDCEFTNTQHVYLSKETALKRWEEIRQELIERNTEVWKNFDNAMYERINKNLRETDPEKMDNHPHEEPFIHEMETEE
ncbi:MAG: hypothetical protein WC648_04810 [Candidatus Paceibacterota bacterium]|jgi:hypothetical protein